MAEAPVLDLRSVIEDLARLDRASCSPGEREAARRIAAALREGGVEAEVEIERVHGTYWWPFGISAAVGILAALAGRRGRRMLAMALGMLASVTVVDEVDVGRRYLRRLLPKRDTANVVGCSGPRGAERTVLLVAHHDAAHTSIFFHPFLTGFAADHLPGAAHDEPPLPLLAPVAAAPLLAGLAGAAGLRRTSTLAAVVCAGVVASFSEMALRATVPGANDNLTGVATLLGVARSLGGRPLEHLRVLLVSTGAEESLMEGMRAFMVRHGGELTPERTTVLCVDTVGSPELVLPEAEGLLAMRSYDEEVKALFSSCAASLGIPLRRGMRVRLGTDAYLALKRKIPAAMLMSVDHNGVSSNYHLPTDTPANVDYDRLDDAVRLCEAVLRRLDGAASTAEARLQD